MQRTRKALEPPGEARDDMWILGEIARRHGPRLGRPDRRAGLGRGALALADARRHAVRPARGARRHPVAVPGRGASRLADPARAALARSGRGPAGAVLGRRAPAAVRVARRRVPAAPDDRPPARVVQHRRADEPLLARRCTAASRSTSRRRTPTACCSRRARSCGLVAPRIGRGAGPHRPRAAARASLHDVPLPRPGRLERAHDRRHRPAQRHRRVQGRGDPRGQDRVAARHTGAPRSQLPAEITGD